MYVQNALQLDASKVKIGTKMQHVITSLMPSFRKELSCDGFTISVLPYKLVLYEEGGGFFLPYHDTEKVPGMFACPPNVCLPPPTKKALSWREVGGCEQLFLCHMFPFVASSLTRATLVIQLPARGAGCAAQE